MTTDREQRWHRVLALAGLWLLLAGLLSGLGFVVFVVIATAVLLLVALAAGGVVLLRRARIGRGVRIAVASTERAGRSLAGSTGRAGRSLDARLRELGLGQRARRVGTQAKATAQATPGRTRVLLVSGSQAYAAAYYRVSGLASKALRIDPSRQALRLNEHGAQLRRSGSPERAAAQHRVALAIVRDLGDKRAEALTLNNLALALAQGGADEAAVSHFEQALSVLRELGDEEYEGQVTANLGSVRRRQGRSEEAVTLLHEALDKLPPESPAYRRVEEQLQRAS